MKRGKPLKRRRRLRQVSPKRKALLEKRRAFVHEILRVRERCEAGLVIGAAYAAGGNPGRWPGCWTRATEVHEPLTRARAPGAETILNPENALAVCRGCHTWIHEHPARAQDLGLLKASWEAV